MRKCIAHIRRCCPLAKQDAGQTLEDETGHAEDRSKDRAKPSGFLYQTMALLKKRLLTFGRDKRMWAFVVFMPFLFAGLGTLVILGFNNSDLPALALSPQVKKYGVGSCSQRTTWLSSQFVFVRA